MANPAEVWKAEKHGFDVWTDVQRYAAAATPMKQIDAPDLERMKWYGFFYRKRDGEGRYMNRIRITACEMTSKQAQEIAFIAYELGHGIVDVTTRANLQVQGLKIEKLPEVSKRLERVGLTSKQTGHDNIRNVFGHPFSGLMADEIIDTNELAHQITALFIDSREYSDLPRKMNICLNGTPHHSAHFWTQDISFLAVRNEAGEPRFQLLLGGTQGQNPHLAWFIPVLVAPEQVVDVTRSVLDLFRARGSREKRNSARFRFLMEELGVDGVLEWFRQDLLYTLEPCEAQPVPASSYDDLIGWFPQRTAGLWTMGLSVPLGRLSWQQFEGLAVLAKKWGDGQLRTTHEQGMAVINIPTAYKDSAATDAAALGLSVQADDLDRQTVACTGNQFCNIAVVETKGQMFQLMSKLRTRGVKLHGIRIHMSGCPSSCAQHFTADIGLKGVRVRRLLGTREGFDVFLGGGISGGVHMGLPYRTGVDTDQLPQLIEEVVTEYYRRHQVGQTFSAYWREQLRHADSQKTGDDDYQTVVWICENCQHRHTGEDPPVFCPSCAGLRRYFARLEEGAQAVSEETPEAAPVRSDGFVYAADDSALEEGQGLTVTVSGKDLALFRSAGQVLAMDSECPHEGAPLAEGELRDGVVICPWHAWQFDACTGCGLEPKGQDVKTYKTLVEGGKIFVSFGAATTNGKAPAKASGRAAAPKKSVLAKPLEVELTVCEVIQETADVKTFRLDNSERKFPVDLPGRFAKVCVSIDGADVWRSFTICSSPTSPDRVDLTIKLNPHGQVSRYLFEHVQAGSSIKIKGPHGGFCFDAAKHAEPLVLVSAGSGITPMMSIARYLKSTKSETPCLFLHGARTASDILFHDECRKLSEEHAGFRYVVTLSQPDREWGGECGRLDPDRLRQWVHDLAACRYFICGPNELMETFREMLTSAGVAADRIHTEQFHATPARA